MKFIDISMPLKPGVVTWDNQDPFKRKEIRAGGAVTSKLNMGTHTGTHIDAPKHFVRGGKSVDQVRPDVLIGSCRVLDAGSEVTVEFLKKSRIKKGERILFKTTNSKKKLLSKKKFIKDYASLDMDAAKFLAKKGAALVGVDYLGIEKKGAKGHPVHKTLLRKNIVVVEGLDLTKAKPGRYNLAVLPLRIVGADGSPARAVLWS